MVSIECSHLTFEYFKSAVLYSFLSDFLADGSIVRDLTINPVSLLEIFLVNLSDYTVDRRGDIGSVVRECSVKGLQVINSTYFLAITVLSLFTSIWVGSCGYNLLPSGLHDYFVLVD